MSTVTVRTNVRVSRLDFNKHVAVYTLAMGKAVADVVRDQARLLCQDMCDYTPPFPGATPSQKAGFTTAAKKKGMEAVSRDVRKIFAPIAQAPAAAVAASNNIGVFSAWVRAKQKLDEPHEPSWVFAMINQRGIIGAGEYERFQQFEANRGNRQGHFMLGTTEGRVRASHEYRRGERDYKVTKTDKYGLTYVDDWNVVERYIRRVQNRVGKLKSGWYYAGKTLGRMPIAAWIANQGSSYSICRPSLDNTLKPEVVVGSTIGRNVSGGYKMLQAAINHRAYSMRVAILHRLKAARNQPTLLDAARRLESGFKIS